MRYLVIICIFLLASPVFASETEEGGVGFFKGINGKVFLQRDGRKIEVLAGQQIQISDTILTDTGSSAAIIFEDGTRVTLGENSQLLIQLFVFVPRHEQYDFSLYLSRGSLIYSSGKLGKLAPEKVNLRTPRATVGIRGTKLLLSVK